MLASFRVSYTKSFTRKMPSVIPFDLPCKTFPITGTGSYVHIFIPLNGKSFAVLLLLSSSSPSFVITSRSSTHTAACTPDSLNRPSDKRRFFLSFFLVLFAYEEEGCPECVLVCMIVACKFTQHLRLSLILNIAVSFNVLPPRRRGGHCHL